MKKLLSLVLAMIMLLTLVACGSNNAEDDVPVKEENQAVTEQQKPEETQKPAEGTTEQHTDAEKPADSEKPAEGEKEEEKKPEEETPVITASHSDVTLTFVGHTFQLVARGINEDAKVTYTSADESIAAVAEDGTVTAAGLGTTQVAMRIEQGGNSYDYSCTVRCKWTEENKTESKPEAPKQEEAPVVQSVDLNQCVTEILNSLGEGNAPAMMDAASDASYVEAFFPGLSNYELKQCVLQMAMMSQVGFELDLVECANASDVEAVKAILQTRIDTQVNGGAWYPAVTAAWENADLVVKGNVVALIVAGDFQDTAVSTFDNMFK